MPLDHSLRGFFMDMLTDKRIERLVKLIHFIGAKENCTKAEIRKTLACSDRTVDYTIKELEKELQQTGTDMAIVRNAHNQYSFSNKDDRQLNEVLRRLFFQDDMVRFIGCSLSGRLSVDSFIQKHFLSRSTFFRKLHKIKPLLHAFHLRFEPRTFKLIGKEHHIRIFYFCFFWEVTGSGIAWPFSIEKQWAKQLFAPIAKAMKLNLSSLQTERFLYWIAIQWLRVKQGHFTDLYDEAFPSDLQTKMLAHAGELLKTVPENIRSSEVQFLLIILLNSPFLYHDAELVASNLAANQLHRTEEWRATRRFARALKKWFSNALDEEAAQRMEGHLLQIHRNKRYFSVNYSSFKERIQLDVLQERHPLITEGVFAAFEKVLAEEMVPFLQMDQAALLIRYILLVYTFADIEKLNEPLNIHIFSSEGPVYEQKLSERMNAALPYHLNVQTSVTYTRDKAEMPAFIVTDTLFPYHEKVDVVYIQSPPTNQDWRRIQQHCEKHHKRAIESILLKRKEQQETEHLFKREMNGG
ncbi:hypothetical protein CHH70_09080 [Shouchella clausii]|nr:hypothetical protein CHH73_11195 [Shouchella clausii]PAD48041.1 hypothetical protein CHI09_05090 [Shouchella clausii]PAE94721.1 hypothetical protein CHH70_09080 [Shouchella clausii]PAF09371.1 hypothetical protein CHH65_09735 [Shouchella clausii]